MLKLKCEIKRAKQINEDSSLHIQPPKKSKMKANFRKISRKQSLMKNERETDVAIKDIVNRTTESREGTDSKMNWSYWT